MSIKQQKLQIIKNYLARWAHLPKQGTKEWILGRVKVGGSELYDAIYSPDKLIKTKLQLKQIPEIAPYNLIFGHIFEDVTIALLQILYKCKIFEGPGSIPSHELPEDKTYSMDGIAVVDFSDGPKITMFEIKNTVSRAIVHGEIFKKYVPQVKGGLCDIEIAERALYVETATKICTREFEIAKFQQIPAEYKTLARGFIAIWSDVETDYSNIDFGEMDKTTISIIMNRIHTGQYTSWLSPMEIFGINGCNIECDLEKSHKQIEEYCEQAKKYYVGTISYVIIDINIVQVEPEPGYTKQYYEQIKEINHQVSEFMKLEEGERIIEYAKRYDKGKLNKMMELLSIDF